jgi:hypothetical protein
MNKVYGADLSIRFSRRHSRILVWCGLNPDKRGKMSLHQRQEMKPVRQQSQRVYCNILLYIVYC